MSEKKIYERKKGKLSTYIRVDKYGVNLGVCMNGFQTTVVGVNDDVLDMLEEIIKEYKADNQKS